MEFCASDFSKQIFKEVLVKKHKIYLEIQR